MAEAMDSCDEEKVVPGESTSMFEHHVMAEVPLRFLTRCRTHSLISSLMPSLVL